MHIDSAELERRKAAAQSWCEAFRDRLALTVETLEQEAPGPFAPEANKPGRLARTPWQRTDHTGVPGGGGVAGLLRGRIFEKIGVHVSTVFGELPPSARADLLGGSADSQFWATGLSLVAHPVSPHVPAVHMNARYIVTATKAWFGGGADLTPMLAARRGADDPDTRAFHAALRQACDIHAAVADYDRFKAWCDDYFLLPHRGESRGVGGIFFDQLDSGDWEADFAFVRKTGEAFLAAYPPIVRANWARPWSAEERDAQLVQRGRYVEFNLIYDRGTLFGLRTGGNIESILSSMPPVVKWP